MFSLKEKEGYLLIDHTDSPGISAEQARKMGSHIVAPGGKKVEASTYMCCGCEATVVLNPDRLRTREYCRECHSYMCDTCALLMKVDGVHRSVTRFRAEYLEHAARGPAALAQFLAKQAEYKAQREKAHQLMRRLHHGT